MYPAMRSPTGVKTAFIRPPRRRPSLNAACGLHSVSGCEVHHGYIIRGSQLAEEQLLWRLWTSWSGSGSSASAAAAAAASPESAEPPAAGDVWHGVGVRQGGAGLPSRLLSSSRAACSSCCCCCCCSSSSFLLLPSCLLSSSATDEDCCASVTLDPLEHEWMLCASDGQWDSLQPLLAVEPSLLSKRDFVTGFTCLHWAAKQGKVELLGQLLSFARDSAVPVDVNGRSGSGYTPMHLAAMHCHTQVGFSVGVW